MPRTALEENWSLIDYNSQVANTTLHVIQCIIRNNTPSLAENLTAWYQL